MPHQWEKKTINVIFSQVCKHEVKHFYSRSSRYQASCFLHWTENKTKRFTHQVAKLDGGEPGLNEWPQAPKEVGRQGEPVFKDKRLSPSFTVLPWFYSVDTISHAVLTVAIPVDLHVHLLLHLHLVLVAQVVKLWVWLAQVALDEVKLKGKNELHKSAKYKTQRYVVKISMTSL